MKKQALLLLAGGMLSLASCTTETHDNDMSQAQIDSTVNARVEEIRMEMMLQNDSLINALAQIKADSILAAMKGGNTVTTKTTTTRKTTVNKANSAGPKDVGGTSSTTTSTGSVSDRKSTQNAQQNTDVSNRKSSQTNQQNADVTNRKSKSN